MSTFPTAEAYEQAIALGREPKPWTSEELTVRHHDHGSEVIAIVDDEPRVTVAWCGNAHSFKAGSESVSNNPRIDAELFALAPRMAKALLTFCELHFDNPEQPAGLNTYLAPLRDQVALIMAEAKDVADPSSSRS